MNHEIEKLELEKKELLNKIDFINAELSIRKEIKQKLFERQKLINERQRIIGCDEYAVDSSHQQAEIELLNEGIIEPIETTYHYKISPHRNVKLNDMVLNKIERKDYFWTLYQNYEKNNK